MRIPKDPFSIEILMREIDNELFNHIKHDLINGTAYQMDDETLELLLIGIWEWDPEDVIKFKGIVLGIT